MSGFTPGAAACTAGLDAAPRLPLASPPMKVLPLAVWLLLLVPALALGLGLHAVVARALKTALARLAPLARGEARLAGYERAVYDSIEPAMLTVALLALAGGAALWFGAWQASPSAWWLAASALLAAVALDVTLWQRVEVGAEHVWFQRSLGGTVHQVLIDNIRDAGVEQRARRGFTLRHGSRSPQVRLKLRMKDRHVVALPKTGVRGGLPAVERCAACIDERLAALRSAEAARRDGVPDYELKRSLRRLRRNAHAVPAT